MANHQKIRDVLGKIQNTINLTKFFKGKKLFDEYIYSLLKPSRPEWSNQNYLMALKRYNSFTPALPRPVKEDEENVRGGGYFLHWEGKGIVIDPGFNFILNLAEVGLTIGNIDGVMLTHGHNDHYIDLDPILSLLYEFNDLNQNNLLGMESFDKGDYESALDHFKRAREIDYSNDTARKGVEACLHRLKKKMVKDIARYEADLKREYSKIKDLPPEKRYKKIDLFLGRSGQKTVDSFVTLNLDQVENVYTLNPETYMNFPQYNLGLYFVRAKHRDFYSKSHCLGIKFDLTDKQGGSFKLGITSDTGYYYPFEKINNSILYKKLSEEFKECKILIAHIGSMLEEEFDWLNDPNWLKDESLKPYLYQKHLGILGLTKLINELDPTILELVVISEYGEEMKDYRIKITDILNSKDAFDKKPVFRTGDIGLKIILDDPIQIEVNNFKDPVNPEDVKERLDKGAVKYENTKSP